MHRSFYTFMMLFALGGALAAPAHGQTFDVPPLAGHIALLGADFNVYLLDGADGTRTALTEDAGRRAGRQVFYQWPTWATDGRLAYFRTTQTAVGSTVEVYVRTLGHEQGYAVYAGENESFNYAYWAPADCAEAVGCRALAVLLNDAQSLFVQRIQDYGDAARAESVLLGRGGPFYVSFSPDGQQLLAQRDNTRLDVFDVATGLVVQDEVAAVGRFPAPAWSPRGDQWLVGLADGSMNTELAVLDAAGGEPRTLVAALNAVVRFGWSPQGDVVAYTNGASAVHVVRVADGKPLYTSPQDGVLAFFWSPDGAKLATLTVGVAPQANSVSRQLSVAQQGARGLVWTVVDVGSGQVVARSAPFVPTSEFVYLLTYFDQFSQSHALWSPDSRYLLSASTDEQGRPQLTILDTEADSAVSWSLGEGRIGIWSFDDTRSVP